MFDLDRLTDIRVLVVGDVMLDRYWFGDVSRISPEAPVPVVAVDNREERAGGAANVARNVAALGANCLLLSVIGNDEAGTRLADILDQSGIQHRLNVDPETGTTVKLRVMSRNQQLIRLDFETRPSHEILTRCLDDYRELVSDSDIVILSDYGKGGLTHIADMVAIARQANVPVVIDPKGRDFSRYRGASMVTPNTKELEAAVREWQSDEELDALAFDLLRQLEVERLLLTRSEKGLSLYHRDGTVLHSQARAREVFDVTGAGDTVIAVVATALGAGATEEEALRIGNTAAGIVVGKLGTATSSLEELRHALSDAD
jgi:rfaE bifunctional protein kinase chain/domain